MPDSTVKPSARVLSVQEAMDRYSKSIPRARGLIEPEDEAYLLSRSVHFDTVLQDSLRLARRITFCDIGRQLAVEALLIFWTGLMGRDPASPLSAEQRQKLSLAAIDVITKVEALPMSIAMDRKIRGYAQIIRDPFEIHIRWDICKPAAEAQCRLQSDPSSDAQLQRDRQVFYLAFIIAQQIQRPLVKSVMPREVSDLFEAFINDDKLSPTTSEPREVAKDWSGSSSFWQVGWYVEESMLGGRLAKVLVSSEDISGSNTFRGAITGLIVMKGQEDVRGYFRIRDDVIQRIVEGLDNWEDSLPLIMEQHSPEGFTPGEHPNAFYRPRDGSIAGEEMVSHTNRPGCKGR